MVWYGGLHWRRRRAFFADYKVCSFVRIEGGPFKRKYRPTFVAGISRHRYIRRKGSVCASTSQYVHECGGLECKQNRVQYSVPGVFRWGKHPRTLLRSDFVKTRHNVPDSELVTESEEQEMEAIQNEQEETAVDQRHADQEEAAEAAQDLSEEQAADLAADAAL